MLQCCGWAARIMLMPWLMLPWALIPNACLPQVAYSLADQLYSR